MPAASRDRNPAVSRSGHNKAMFDSSPALPLPVTPQPIARMWREAFARLSAQTPPYPGINLKKWPEMHTVALRLLAEHADRAAELLHPSELLGSQSELSRP